MNPNLQVESAGNMELHGGLTRGKLVNTLGEGLMTPISMEEPLWQND